MKDTTDRFYLQYNFFIDEGIWSSLSDFEDWLSKALEGINTEGVMINNVNGLSGFQRTVHIKRKAVPPALPIMPQSNTHGKAPSIQIKEVARGITPPERFKGKFVKRRNG